MLLQNGNIFRSDGTFLEHWDIRCERGQIKMIAENIKPLKDEETVNLNGYNVFPGFIDAHSHVGLYSDPGVEANNDGNEIGEPVSPEVRAIDAINLEDLALKDAVNCGITSVFTGPGSANIIGGQSAFIKTAGSNIVDRRVVMSYCGLKAALGENPKVVYGSMKKTPSTRMGNAAIMRKTFVKAQNYMKKLKKGEDVERDLGLEAIIDVLKRKVPLRCHAHRVDDIATIIRIRDEFGFDLVIEHATDGHKIPDYIAEKKVPCVVGPSMTARCKEELKDKTFATPNILHSKGVLFAITTDAPVLPLQYLPVMAGFAVKEGLPWNEAIKGITINAAEICGVSSRVGSIDVGKDADITVYRGDPLSIEGKCMLTVVDGKIEYCAL